MVHKNDIIEGWVKHLPTLDKLNKLKYNFLKGENDMNLVKNYFKDWSKLDIVWLVVANLSILGCSIYWGDNLFLIIMALTGISANLLVAKGKILNYPLGIVNVIMYGYVAYKSALYGDFTLNIFFYLPMNILGWYLWKKKSNDNSTVESKKLTTKQLLLVLGVTLSLWIGYGCVLTLQNGSLPFIDSASTVLSVVSMILMIKCYREQWFGWIIVNLISILMWYISIKQGKGDLTTLFMWIVYLTNSVYGCIMWIKGSKGVKDNG